MTDKTPGSLKDMSDHDLILTTAVKVHEWDKRFDKLEDALGSKVGKWTFGIIITVLLGAGTAVIALHGQL